MNQKQWLNIVIIVISAMILVFMLIGRFMNRAVEDADRRASEQQNKPVVEEQQKKDKKNQQDKRY